MTFTSFSATLSLSLDLDLLTLFYFFTRSYLIGSHHAPKTRLNFLQYSIVEKLSKPHRVKLPCSNSLFRPCAVLPDLDHFPPSATSDKIPARRPTAPCALIAPLMSYRLHRVRQLPAALSTRYAHVSPTIGRRRVRSN